MKNRNKSQNMEQLGVSMSRSSRCATMEATEFEWEATDRLREASKTWDLCKKNGDFTNYWYANSKHYGKYSYSNNMRFIRQHG